MRSRSPRGFRVAATPSHSPEEETIRKGTQNDKRSPQNRLRVNNRIRVPEVRVIMEDGEQKGIMATRDALRLADEKGLDLVEIAPTSRPPVCRIMDFGRFKYEESKKKRATKRKSSTLELKEIKFRPKTDQHDMEFKIRHVRRFLEEGNKCRLVIVFRGREITHPETGVAVLDRVVESVKDIGTVEVRPNMEGRRMIMIVAPLGGVVRRAAPKPVAEAKPTESKPSAPEPAIEPDASFAAARRPTSRPSSSNGPSSRR